MAGGIFCCGVISSRSVLNVPPLKVWCWALHRVGYIKSKNSICFSFVLYTQISWRVLGALLYVKRLFAMNEDNIAIALLYAEVKMSIYYFAMFDVCSIIPLEIFTSC